MNYKQFFQKLFQNTVSFWKKGTIQRVSRITYDVVWNVALFFIIIGAVGLFLGVGIGAGYFASLVKDEEVRSYDEMEKAIYNYEETSELYFADNIYIGDIQSDLHREETTLDQISDTLINAVIATEDEYFDEHEGIVPKAIVRALVQEFTNANMQSGGSTLTQQLIKNQILTNEVSFERKAKEMLLALRLERFFEKDEILEAYLNIVPYGRDSLGQNIAGIQTASKEIFGIDASEVNLPQAAYLAGLPQSPSYYTPFNSLGNGGGLKSERGIEPGINRMKTVLSRMYDMEFIDETSYQQALQYDITEDFILDKNSPSDNYPYLVNELQRRAKDIIKKQLAEEDGHTIEEVEADNELNDHYDILADRDLKQNGYQIHSTINKELYDSFQEVVKNFDNYGPDIVEPKIDEETGDPIIDDETGEVVMERKPVQTASMLIDNKTGAILSFAGGREFSLENQYNFATQGQRPNGSTMKSLLDYAPALEKGYLQPGSPIADVFLSYPIPGQPNYEPTNISQRYYGIVPARRALASSYNVSAVKVYLNMIHENPAEEYLTKMGITTLTESDYSIPSLAIGGMDHGILIEENINAYSTFGNNGKFVDGYMIEKIVSKDGEVIYEHESEEVHVFSEQTNYLMIDMMRDVLRDGTASYLTPRLNNQNVDWAGKTGTSSKAEDHWFIATNPNVTFGTWIGYEDPASLDCSGCDLYSFRNLQLWAEFVNTATEINPELMAPTERFQQPDGIVSRSICAISGMLPSELCSELGLVTTDLFNSKFVPTKRDDSLMRGSFVTVDGKRVPAGPRTPEEFIDGDGIVFSPEFLERYDYDQLDDISELFPDTNRSAWEKIGLPSTDSNAEIEDDGKAPSAPSSIKLSGRNLIWKASSSKDVVGYRIYRAATPDDNPELIGSTTELEFSIPNIDGVYHVTAVDYFGRESSASDVVERGDFSDDEEDEEEDDGDDEDDEDEEDDKERIIIKPIDPPDDEDNDEKE